VSGGLRRHPSVPPSRPAGSDTGDVVLTRRTAAFLVLAGLWPLLIWPNFVRVVATDERAFDGGPTAYLVVHAALAAGSMALGVVLVWLGVRGWRRAGG
jgi:hypothetical protein